MDRFPSQMTGYHVRAPVAQVSPFELGYCTPHAITEAHQNLLINQKYRNSARQQYPVSSEYHQHGTSTSPVPPLHDPFPSLPTTTRRSHLPPQTPPSQNAPSQPPPPRVPEPVTQATTQTSHATRYIMRLAPCAADAHCTGLKRWAFHLDDGTECVHCLGGLRVEGGRWGVCEGGVGEGHDAEDRGWAGVAMGKWRGSGWVYVRAVQRVFH